jgi:hypothetical protein
MLWKKTKQTTKSDKILSNKPLENDELLWAYEIMQFF